tara:strand:- start:20 stop:298 length:279 start_codon:yes stop_codon:yes gene_type:complete
MISINRNDPPFFDEDEDDLVQDLAKKLKNEIDLLDLLNLNDDPSQVIIKEGNTKDLIDIVYKKLYDENNQTLNIIVGKNDNNSLGIILDVIE